MTTAYTLSKNLFSTNNSRDECLWSGTTEQGTSIKTLAQTLASNLYHHKEITVHELDYKGKYTFILIGNQTVRLFQYLPMALKAARCLPEICVLEKMS